MFLYYCVSILAIKANAVGVAGMSLGESVTGLPFVTFVYL